jgi:hypothetical protein
VLEAVRDERGADSARNLAALIFPRVAEETGRVEDNAEGLLRLLWMQPDHGAQLAETFLVRRPDRASEVFTRLVAATPPIHTFLALRRLLLERVLPGATSDDTRLAHAVHPFSPRLANHLAGDARTAAAQPRRSI